MTSIEQECGEQSNVNGANQTDAGSALLSPAAETRQTIDPEPQHPLAKETLINSLDCQGLCMECSIFIYLNCQ